MKFKKCYFIFILFFIFTILFPKISFASSDLSLKNLSYEIVLNEDGSAFITENWDISIEDTNTLFKTFDIDDSKYSGISDVSVIETTNGINKSFTQIYQELYHVPKDCFYALEIDHDTFEIAWGVSEDDSYARRSFQISYLVSDVIKNYADCSEFYWQLIGTSSSIPAKNVTGTITLPNQVSNLEFLRVWAHGPLNGVIEKTSANTVTFSVENLSARTMLEVRVVTPTTIFSSNTNTSTKQQLSSILEEEEKWANEANLKRTYSNMLGLLVIVVIIITFIFCISRVIKYIQLLKNLPKLKPTQKLEYFRDFPDETATPAEIDFIYHHHSSTIFPQTLSAILLDLCMKGFLSFETSSNKKKDISIALLEKDDSELPPDEKYFLKELQKISAYSAKKHHSTTFDMEDFKNYYQKHTSSFTSLSTNLLKEAKKTCIEKGIYDKAQEKNHTKWEAKMVLYLFFAIFSLPAAIICSSTFDFTVCAFMLLLTAIFFLLFILSAVILGRYQQFTQAGVDAKEQLNGLKNYLLHFSNMKEKDVPSLVLWEKYLMYATIFGIADRVLKQLKVIYPEMMDENYMLSNHYTYLSFISHSHMDNFFFSLQSSMINAYHSTYSSGSGGGGGFSGGGGGRRWRRPEWADAN